MASGTNFYRVDLRSIEFTLYEHLHVEQVFEHGAYSHLSREECDEIIGQCVRFVTEVTGPLNRSGDKVGCRFTNGEVATPPGFKEAWKKLYELGFMSFSMPQEAGGFGGPYASTSSSRSCRAAPTPPSTCTRA